MYISMMNNFGLIPFPEVQVFDFGQIHIFLRKDFVQNKLNSFLKIILFYK